MAAQAAHLVDWILPAVPIRQLVLSFPFELSLLAATKPEVLRALARIHAEELARHYKQAAKKSGEGGKLHAGAVTFVQRFGSSLNLHVHLHTCALDGVYVESDDDDALRFVPAAPPSRAELYVLTERVALRVMTWLRKRGHAKDDDHASNDTPDRSFAEVLAHVATQRGTLENVKDDTGESEGPAEPAGPLVDEAVTRHGFNMHAGLTISADDDLGRERLCRYGLRPAFSLSRFGVLRDGRMSYRVKRSSRRTSRCRIMTPVECIARLCALVPPPRYPLKHDFWVFDPCAYRYESDGAHYDYVLVHGDEQPFEDAGGPAFIPVARSGKLTLYEKVSGPPAPSLRSIGPHPVRAGVRRHRTSGRAHGPEDVLVREEERVSQRREPEDRRLAGDDRLDRPARERLAQDRAPAFRVDARPVEMAVVVNHGLRDRIGGGVLGEQLSLRQLGRRPAVSGRLERSQAIRAEAA